MKATLAILLLLFAMCYQPQTTPRTLEDAYAANSTKLLHQFYTDWNREIKPATDSELNAMNDTLKQAYLAFTAFYKPLNIEKLGGSEWGNDIYKSVDFFVVQNYVKIYFTPKLVYSAQDSDDRMVNYIKTTVKDTAFRARCLKRYNGKLSQMVRENFWPDMKDTLADSIINFRPQINCDGKLPLYLNSKYEDILNRFLGDDHYQLGRSGMMTPATSKGESERRKEFLEKGIKIFYGHWGGYWQFNSYPVAGRITFDRQMRYAKVNFRMVYQGGEAILENDNGKWKLISSRLTWIE